MKTYLMTLIGSVCFLLNAKADTLWIERFDLSDGPIDNRGSGDYWYDVWSTQNDYPDYRVESATPLTYPGANTSGGYLVGGDDFVATGRYVNAYGYDGHFQDEDDRIGLSGTTIYLSFLIRKNYSATEFNAPVEIVLSDSEVEPYIADQRLVAIGYPGPDANTATEQFWALDVYGSASGLIVTDSVIRYDETYLMVVSILFQSPSVVRLWINPSVDDLNDLGTPSATAITTENIGFWSVIFNAAYGGTNHGAIDEIVFHDPTYDVLPVELMTFKGSGLDGIHQLKWATATEKDNMGFEIQTSTDGTEYHKIGWVDGHANSKTKIDYAFEITEPEGQYYRLKQIDFDGQFDFSPTVYIDSQPKILQGQISPNPYTKGEKLRIPNSGYTSAVIYDLQGKSWKIEQSSNLSEEIELKLLGLRTGLYTIQLMSTDGRSFKSKLLITD